MQNKIQRLDVIQLEAFDSSLDERTQMLLHSLGSDFGFDLSVRLGERAITLMLAMFPLSPERP